VSHFHVFRCPIYIHIPKEKTTNLEPSSLKGVFIGYSESSEAYRVYIPLQLKILVSQDMMFDGDAWFSRS
jgi:hypothetical protein